MKRIREKLRSESGASILLALLFFLLCTMVGASVLMAAASNAGKSRSGRVEQQKYLTLSSAMQLVCDELTAAQYTAKFNLTRIEDIMKNVGTETEPEWVVDYRKYYYTQKVGDYTGKLPESVLPLRNALDSLFAGSLPQTLTSGKDQYIYETGSGITAAPGGTFTLTLTVDQADKPGLAQPVKVEVTLAGNYQLSLKAWLGNDSDYTMYGALLTTGAPEITAGATDCSSIGWTLSQITREEAK